MKRILLVVLLGVVLRPALAEPSAISTNTPVYVFAAALNRLLDVIQPPTNAAPQTFSANIKLVRAEGAPKEIIGQTAVVAYQAPDRLKVSVEVGRNSYSAGRDGQELWAYAPGKKFGVVGKPGVPRFATAPEKPDRTQLPPFALPLPREQLALLPLLVKVEEGAAETNENVRCRVFTATPQPQALEMFKLPNGRIELAVRDTDLLPARVTVTDGKKFDVAVELTSIRLESPRPPERWKLAAAEGHRVETTAVAHLANFAQSALASLNRPLPTLPAPKGDRRVVATEGRGRLEIIDGTRVVFLKGTPEEMGRQQGRLLRKQIHDLVDRILYGVGVGSSFDKGRWFFGEIEAAQARLQKFMDPRYLAEMDALAAAAGLEREEVRLANYFPELFHCSGFALYGEATAGGRMFHGRILDYLRGVGLEQNAVVMVFQPDQGNAWVNVGYAGFIGSVTAMNEKHIAMGEMGGRGEGSWDGKPMAELVREVMEKANTIDEAVEIMRRGPRTCEYYYVISDAKSKRAVGLACTADKFETIWAGEAHPQLPHAVKDAVLMSAGDRYEELARRVQAGHGRFDADSARELMSRPVCMKSNIHSVLFAPDTLDFWVANADSKNVASHTHYRHYNLAELLKEPAAAAK